MAPAPSPMLATAGRPPEDPRGWAFEMKWDGMRAVADAADGQCLLYSRNGKQVAGSFPEIVEAVAAAVGPHRVVLDGEIIAPEGARGAPSFSRLQRRMHVRAPTPQLIREVPVLYMLFDLLALDGHATVRLPYTERRDLLARLDIARPPLQLSPSWTDVDPAELAAAATDNGLEGLVAKRLDSVYQPGERSRAWLKMPFRRTTEAVIAGWLPGNGPFQKSFGSLVLGAHDAQGRLVHIGNVGTGWKQSERTRLRQRLDEIARPDSPFDVPAPRPVAALAHWVSPELVADIEYREATAEGLRHPSWRGLRIDKDPAEITWPA
ncbi:non-homologous end-joining DNA ligase [Nocardia farcinica]|uniref:DNA ligase (ATP) n=2 Tax=Nocardia farcinica TaxID=37329 RepID=Q5YVK4_NOCFA|nr:non-homologous end-joining DNA ligase [Nocardia farcinica]BAD57787.1 putative ATP-dependent DNA ligase [Nocardia farcinica IFM 10152]